MGWRSQRSDRSQEEIERMAGIDAAPDALRYNPSDTAQTRLARIQGSIALIGSFASPLPNIESTESDNAQRDYDTAARVALGLYRAGVIEIGSIVGVRSMMPMQDTDPTVSTGRSVELLKEALNVAGYQIKQPKTLPPIEIERRGYDSLSQAAHGALNRAIVDFMRQRSSMQQESGSKKASLLVVTDSATIANIFGKGEFTVTVLKDRGFSGLAEIGITADGNLWLPPKPRRIISRKAPQ